MARKRTVMKQPQDVAASKQPKKRVKTNKSAKTSSLGQQNMKERTSVMSLSIEILLETASYLAPADMLHMSRVCKGLRALFMSRRSEFAWKTSFKEAGLPFCPPDLCYPLCASLLFDRFCMLCLHPFAKRPSIWMRIRLCKTCYADNVKQAPVALPEGLQRTDLIDIVPGTLHKRNVLGRHRKSPIESLPDQEYYIPNLLDICRAYSAFDGDKRLFIAERSKMLNHQAYHAGDVNRWIERQRWEKRGDSARKLNNLYEVVQERLKNLGFSDNDISTKIDHREWSQNWWRVIKKPTKLTEKAWGEMLPQLEEIIRLRRERRLWLEENGCVSEREDRLRELCLDLLLSDKKCQYAFTYEEVRHVKEISDVVEAEGIDFLLVDKKWSEIRKILVELGYARMYDYAQAFRRIITGALTECGVHSLISTAGTTKDPVSIREKIEMPAILDNPCAFFIDTDRRGQCSTFIDAASGLLGATSESFEIDDDDVGDEDAPPVELSHRIARFYETDSWVPDWDAIRVSKALVEELGISEEKSMRDLLSQECSFVCMRCNPLGRTTTTWIGLVKHFVQKRTAYETLVNSKSWRPWWKDLFLDNHNIEDTSKGRMAEILSHPGIYDGHPAQVCDCEKCGDKERRWTVKSCPICQKANQDLGRMGHGFEMEWIRCDVQLNLHVATDHGCSTIEEGLRKLEKPYC